MKVENVTIERKQIVFTNREFTDINNAQCWLKNALQYTKDDKLKKAVEALEDILNNIEIQDIGRYYIFSEEVWSDDA